MGNRFRRATVIVGMALQALALVYDARPARAQAGPAAGDPPRPAYQLGSAGRYDEDWSSLRGVDLRRYGRRLGSAEVHPAHTRRERMAHLWGTGA
jgi:hypothetical protein